MAETIYKDSINRLHESIVWTHKIQRSYLEKLESRYKSLLIISLSISSVSTSSTLMFAIFSITTATIIAAVFSLVSIILGLILSKVETKENIEAFRTSSSSLCELRNHIITFAAEVKAGKINDENIPTFLTQFNYLFTSFTRDLPTIPNKFVEIADRKLKERKDEEIELQII